MKQLFFIIGASGSGKTTAIKEIEKIQHPSFKTLYFDSIGVPSIDEMHQKYGGPEQWQRVTTITWIKQIKQQFLSDVNVIFDGQTRPSFIKEGCSLMGIKTYSVILLDCSDEERKRRLSDRGQKELADENMMDWARYLRSVCKENKYQIIDNTILEPNATISQLLEIIKMFPT